MVFQVGMQGNLSYDIGQQAGSLHLHHPRTSLTDSVVQHTQEFGIVGLIPSSA